MDTLWHPMLVTFKSNPKSNLLQAQNVLAKQFEDLKGRCVTKDDLAIIRDIGCKIEVDGKEVLFKRH